MYIWLSHRESGHDTTDRAQRARVLVVGCHEPRRNPPLLATRAAPAADGDEVEGVAHPVNVVLLELDPAVTNRNYRG